MQQNGIFANTSAAEMLLHALSVASHSELRQLRAAVEQGGQAKPTGVDSLKRINNQMAVPMNRRNVNK